MPALYQMRVMQFRKLWAVESYLPCDCPDCNEPGHWQVESTYHTKQAAQFAMNLRSR